MPQFEIKIRGRVIRWRLQEGITASEFQLALQELDRIAAKDHPELDYTVEPIAVTNDEWYRQKPEGAAFRTIIVFRMTEQEIVVEAILRRDKHTYNKVEQLYEQLKNTDEDE